jgi:hypothetical protein
MVARKCDKGQWIDSIKIQAQKKLRGIPDYLTDLRLRILSLALN